MLKSECFCHQPLDLSRIGAGALTAYWRKRKRKLKGRLRLCPCQMAQVSTAAPGRLGCCCSWRTGALSDEGGRAWESRVEVLPPMREWQQWRLRLVCAERCG